MFRSRLAWLYLSFVGLGWALGEAVGEQTVPTLLLAYAPALLWLLPAPLVLAWTLWRRRGLPVALMAGLLAALGAGVMHLRLQQPGNLRAVSFNVARGTLGRPERMAATVRATKADLILLQETNFVRAGDRAALLARLPGYHVAEGYEVMTLSRLPVVASREHRIPGSRRTVLEVTLRPPGSRTGLRVINAHLNTVLVSSVLRGDLEAVRRTNRARVWQVGLLCKVATQQPGPLLVGGDLNTPPRGRLYRQMEACVGAGAHAQAGRGPGWTFPGLFLRIDHLFARGLRPVKAQVLPPAGSDHRPLQVDLAGWTPLPPPEHGRKRKMSQIH